MSKKKQIGDIIRELRIKKGFSQRQLALYVNISNTALSKIEKNKNKYFDPSLLAKIAKALGTTVEDIMKQVELEDIEEEKKEKLNKDNIQEESTPDEPDIEAIENFLAGQKMLMFKGKLLSQESLKSVYAFLQFLEKEYGDKGNN